MLRRVLGYMIPVYVAAFVAGWYVPREAHKVHDVMQHFVDVLRVRP